MSWLSLGRYRPMLYIAYTLTSQIPRPVLKWRLVWFFTLMGLTELLFMSVQLIQTMGASEVIGTRSFITMRDPTRVADASAFDNLRTADQPIDKASIQADVIREPYVRLFVSYPKVLDAELAKRFKKSVWPDSLSRKERREKQAAWYLQTFEAYFGVYLNDSLYRSPGFLFTQYSDSGQPGLTTVLMTDNLKPGRNTLTITVPDSVSKPKPYCQIPFWYMPEK